MEVPLSLRQSIEQSKCEYRRLGNSGLTVSVPIFGCMSFGDPRTIDWYSLSLSHPSITY